MLRRVCCACLGLASLSTGFLLPPTLPSAATSMRTGRGYSCTMATAEGGSKVEPIDSDERKKLREILKPQGVEPAHRRVLSLDGGGVRGALTAEILFKLQQDLRAHYGCEELMLSDYFHVVGGTSTGSLLAAGIAIGLDAAQLQKIYADHGKDIFPPKTWLGKAASNAAAIFKRYSKYSPDALVRILKTVLGDTKFSDELQCDLVVVAECVTKYSLSNPSLGTIFFNSIKNTLTYQYSEKVMLWQACRASSAAPTFFPPFEMDWNSKGFSYDPHEQQQAAVASSWANWLPWGKPASAEPNPEKLKKATFIDGGMSGYNNPEHVLLTALTSERYQLKWPTGPTKFLLVSLGTGYGYGDAEEGAAGRFSGPEWAGFVIGRLMGNAVVHQSLSASVKCWSVIDTDRSGEDRRKKAYSQVSQADQEKNERRLATRVRINIAFDREKLGELREKWKVMSDKDLESLSKMDDANAIGLLQAVGKELADKWFDIEKLKDFLPHKLPSAGHTTTAAAESKQ